VLLSVLVCFQLVVVVLQAESSRLSVGSVFSDRDFAHRLAVCPYFRQTLYNLTSNLYDFRCWNMCDLDKKHCDFRGCRLKFKPCFDGVRVAWVCPKLVDVSVEEFEYYG